VLLIVACLEYVKRSPPSTWWLGCPARLDRHIDCAQRYERQWIPFGQLKESREKVFHSHLDRVEPSLNPITRRIAEHATEADSDHSVVARLPGGRESRERSAPSTDLFPSGLVRTS
jgi:hypothetical protein